MKEENIIPEAGNLYSALRNSGYSNIAAMGDLIDNSLDAGAKTIRIDIAEDMKQIFLSDDGVGMSMETLNQALKLGGRKVHDNINDLGKYGLGLITASISMGPKLRVITRNDGQTNVGIFDVAEVCDSNKFVASFREANESEINSFDYRTNNAKSGTVLIIENCDKIQFMNVEEFVEELKEYIETAFWAFIRDGRTIIVNDKTAQSKDPLYGFDERTQVRVNKTVLIPIGDGNEKKEKLEILAVMLPDFGKSINRSLRINIENQGFYVLRNNREIAPAVEILDVFKKHNDFNRLRIKLNFGPGLDEEMGVNYTKHSISPNKKIINVLKRELGDEITKIRKEIKEKQKKDKSKGKGKPKNPITGPGTATLQPTTDNGSTTELTAGQQNAFIKDVDIDTRYKSENDKLFDLTKSEDCVSVWYNGANKFYKNSIVEKENGAEIKKYIDVLLKAFIESSVKNNISFEVVEKISEDISSALEKSE
jgi:hypothetical protein